MYTNIINQNFSGGEVSPKMVGRADLPVYKTVCEWMENFIVLPQGPYQFRQGTSYIHHTRLNQFAILIPFQFNDIQAYLIEATNLKFRFYKESGIITEAGVAIQNISQTNPAVVDSTAHGYSDGDEVFIYDVVGMTEINGRSYIVTNSTVNDYELYDEFGNTIDATGFTAYSSGGESFRVYEIDTPYTEASLRALQYAQNADTQYLVHRGFAPRKLVRAAETSWTLSTYVRLNDPFPSSSNWPGSVIFTSDGRILFGGTTNKPESLFFSRAPNSAGLSRYDDFTTGSLKTDAVTYTMAPLQGKVDSIRWLANTDKFIVAGTFGSVRRVYGATEASPVTPTDINIKSVNNYGVARSLPVANGTLLLYIQRDNSIIRTVEYDYQIDGYQSLDKNLIADHILKSGIVRIVNQSGNPELLWAVRTDGRFVGLTYNDKENKYGWHRHRIGSGLVEELGVMPRETSREQVWFVVNRTINGNTVRHIEVMTDEPIFPQPLHFRSGNGQAAKKADNAKYSNALYEKQKDAVHLDSSIMYDGSALGLAEDISITPGSGATVRLTEEVVFTADDPIFTVSMVDRHIWKKYDENGNGGGRAIITAFNSSTEVECTIIAEFDNLNAMSPGNWFLTAKTISGLHHLEGEEVSVVNDGAVHPSLTVENGQVVLGKQASKIIIGLPYVGLMQTMLIDQGGASGPAVSKEKNINELHIRCLNTAGISFGTDPYFMDKMDFRTTGQITGRPIPLFTGAKIQTYEDETSRDKHVYIMQDTPLPATIISIEPYTDTVDE